MKQRISVIVLILEIAAIAILHTVKFNQESAPSRNRETVESGSKKPVEASAKSPLLLTKLQ